MIFSSARTGVINTTTVINIIRINSMFIPSSQRYPPLVFIMVLAISSNITIAIAVLGITIMGFRRWRGFRGCRGRNIGRKRINTSWVVGGWAANMICYPS